MGTKTQTVTRATIRENGQGYNSTWSLVLPGGQEIGAHSVKKLAIEALSRGVSFEDLEFAVRTEIGAAVVMKLKRIMA